MNKKERTKEIPQVIGSNIEYDLIFFGKGYKARE